MNIRKLIRKIINEGQFDLDPKYFMQGSYHIDFPDFFDPLFNKTFADHPYPPSLGVTMNQSALSEKEEPATEEEVEKEDIKSDEQD